jgi:sugar lactone lactonase YvrE
MGRDAYDGDVLTRMRRVAVAVLVCGIAVSACSPSGPAPVSLPVTPSPTLALATPPPLPAGTITTYAGRGSGDGGPASAAQLRYPWGVAVDPAGNLYIAEHDDNRIRKVTPGGTISTHAGSGTRGFSGDGGPATAAQLDAPLGVALDSAGNLYVADSVNGRIRKVTPASTISTFAGGSSGFLGDGGPATAARLGPVGVAFDSGGNLYVADWFNGRIRKVTPGGTISTYAGTGTPGFSGDGGPATAAQLSFPYGADGPAPRPIGVALDPAGNLYIADTSNWRIRKVSTGGTISTYAGNGTPGAGFSGDGGPATAAQLDPVGVALDSAGNLYIGDSGNERIRKVSPGGTISTYAGGGTPGFSGDGGPATAAQLDAPLGVALDSVGNLFIADSGNERIRKVSPAGTISTYAGSGTPGFSGDGGPATAAQLNSPRGVALDSAGNLYIADSVNGRIRKVTPGGTISTYAGSGTPGGGFSGDGGPATAAQLRYPTSVALDSAGNLYIADSNNDRIRKVSPGGTISTYAGGGTPGFLGDGGPATAAYLSFPTSVALDSAGNLYITETDNGSIRKVTPGGTISTYAAQVRYPVSVALHPAGNLYIAELDDHRIRKITPGGTISTYAGSGTRGFSGDGGPATAAQLSFPASVALDPAGNLYIAEQGNNVVRRVTP